MKLYVCYSTRQFPVVGGHACANAYDALKEAGHAPAVVRSYGSGFLPSVLNLTPGRREVRRLTGQSWVPVLVTNEGEVVAGSKRIVDWARSHPAGGPSRA
jgi:hypothetical protein